MGKLTKRLGKKVDILCNNMSRFLSKAVDQTLFYNEDKLSVKWATEFYEKIGKFRRERANLKASKAAEENEDHYMDEA